MKGLSAFSLSLGEIMELGAVQCPELGRTPQTSVLPGDVAAEASQCGVVLCSCQTKGSGDIGEAFPVLEL